MGLSSACSSSFARSFSVRFPKDKDFDITTRFEFRTNDSPRGIATSKSARADNAVFEIYGTGIFESDDSNEQDQPPSLEQEQAGGGRVSSCRRSRSSRTGSVKSRNASSRSRSINSNSNSNSGSMRMIYG